MKIWSLPLVLAWALPCVAQEAATDGYAKLSAASKLVKPGENGTPSTADKLKPTENLRRQRVAVARNAPALAAVREALKTPISFPQTTEGPGDELGSRSYTSLREVARQFRQESDVRAADGDWVGALDSRLVTIEMGASMTKGGHVLPVLVGTAIEAIGRRDMEPILAKLDAPALRAGLERLKAIDERRASFIDIEKAEKRNTLRETMSLFTEPEYSKMKANVATQEGRAAAYLNKAESEAFLTLKPEEFKSEIESSFDAVIALNESPYQKVLKARLPQSKNAYVEYHLNYFRSPLYRFNYERNLTDQKLLEGAVELRAIKLETGAYPENYDAGIDPFGDGGKLVYRRKGTGYQLYSIGPDGKDNAGVKFKSLAFDEVTGRVLERNMRAVLPESKGDIPAPKIGD